MYLIFVASLQENVKLANVLKEELEKEQKKVEIINLVSLYLPMYDSIKENEDGIPKEIGTIIEKMEAASGYIFVSPEYNYSMPPVLTNFVAWVSRSSEDFRKVFTDRFILLATHSGAGGSDVTQAMRSQFTKLGAFVLPREIITTYQHAYKIERVQKVLRHFIKYTSDKE